MIGALPYLAVFIGIVIGGVINILNNSYFTSKLAQNNNYPVPEARLPPMMIGSILFTAGFYIFAWTSDPRIYWMVLVFATALIGIGIVTIFQGCLNYLIRYVPSRMCQCNRCEDFHAKFVCGHFAGCNNANVA